MFADAIDRASKFTKAIHLVTKHYGADDPTPGAGTLFFVNAEGWAITCKHVTDILLSVAPVNKRFQDFKTQRDLPVPKQHKKRVLKDLEKRFGYSKGSLEQLQAKFVDAVGTENGAVNFRVVAHQEVDLALIKFENAQQVICDEYPVFPRDTTWLKQGRVLCRLGYPFAEFSDFQIDPADQTLKWTNTGRSRTPRFPIDGMVTRFLESNNSLIGIELSTPGLRGQSGGPLFDTEGRVWGVQAQTAHLDLSFDVDQMVVRSGVRERRRESAFLHVGHCVHIDIVKSFLRANAVQFQES